MIGIVDYGVGNLFSLRRSLEYIGADSFVSSDADKLSKAAALILPGVGAFGDARQKLKQGGLDDMVVNYAKGGRPLLGVCLGMQLLLDESEEFGVHQGLHLLPGQIVGMAGRLPEGLKIPHIGWNALRFTGDRHPMFRHVNEGDCVYFVHSYYLAPGPHTVATCEYGLPITAAVGRKNVWGCQFHPEKSGRVGLNILRAFMEEAR